MIPASELIGMIYFDEPTDQLQTTKNNKEMQIIQFFCILFLLGLYGLEP